MDNSFVVLPKQKPQPQGMPPRPRGGAGQPDMSHPGKTMEESFVVVYKSESASDGGGTHLPSAEGGSNGHLQPHNSGFHSTITVLKRAFEIATNQTQVYLMQRNLDESTFCLKILLYTFMFDAALCLLLCSIMFDAAFWLLLTFTG